MPRRSRQNPSVREFILRHVEAHPDDIGPFTAKEFGISRSAVARYLRRLTIEGMLSAAGKTKARRYKLASILSINFSIELSIGLAEDSIWRFRIRDYLKDIPQNVIDICQYGFTEILNNAIDHSGSIDAVISFDQTYGRIYMLVIDHGIGIFQKIQNDFRLEDPRMALLELSKGKLTSDARHHAGEGIFFTSRMFDEFHIRSGNLLYARKRKEADYEWLVEMEEAQEYKKGTAVHMIISTTANWTKDEVMRRYQDDNLLFRRTHVPIKLAVYPGEQLVSRSQAKRILSRFERFSEIILDFQGVPQIGQAFADEIFRVFKNEHPEIGLYCLHTSPDVDRMIAAVQKAAESDSMTIVRS